MKNPLELKTPVERANDLRDLYKMQVVVTDLQWDSVVGELLGVIKVLNTQISRKESHEEI